ncbi:MAG: hypothetical protein JWQ07_5283, partial [Ramlibacter sp.]|nr:hypothetical protein [Ramlibacter sp.]
MRGRHSIHAALFGHAREADKVFRSVADATGEMGLSTSRATSLSLTVSPSRKAILQMTPHTQRGPRRMRATIIGLGLDGLGDGTHRIITGEECLMVGGSAETNADLLETMLRLESELDRLGCGLADLDPSELADVAWRIDSPELHEIAMRIEAGLVRRGRTFREST